MPTNRATSRARASARNEILTMLKDDHKRAKRAFRDFEKLDPDSDQDKCRELVAQTCGELEVHATLEEELFYPAVRECIKEEDLIDEAEVEHMTAKTLIAQLKDMTPDDPKYAASFTVLGEYVKHHIKEEENEVFPQLSRARLDWDKLCDLIHERRDQLMEEYLPQTAGTANKEAGKRASASA
jgi:hemerythrin-like domain-containing protein